MFDVLTFGRCGMDIYALDIGAAFEDIRHFSASVGGSPANIAIGAARLGLKSALFSAVGADPVGNFILHNVKKEGVDTAHVQVIPGTTSAAVLCGIIPPDTFPLVFYRDNAPDNHIQINMADKVDFSQYKTFLMTGTALSVEPTRSAAFYAVEQARKKGCKCFLDIDFRANLWADVRAFGVVLRQYLPFCTVVMGTEEELLAMTLQHAAQVHIKNNAITAPEITGDIEQTIQEVLQTGIQLLLVKRGARGVSAYHSDGRVEHIAGFPVEVVNVLGAGDAFAAGFIYGYIQGWSGYKSARLANACGAWLVSKQGCSKDAPDYEEITAFIAQKGGF